MKLDRSFLQAILETPDDDAPRLVFADWLDEHGEEARAEFIRVQCELARREDEDLRRTQGERRQRALLAKHGDRWREELPAWARKGSVFRRGFVEEVTAKAPQFVKGARALFAQAPVRRLRLIYPLRPGLPPIVDEALAACSWLERLSALDLSGYPQSGPLGDAGVRALVASPHLQNLQTLDLSGNKLTAEGFRAIANSPHLSNLLTLRLSGNPFNPAYGHGADEGVCAVAASPYLANLRGLHLEGNGITDKGFRAVVDSRYLQNLETLVVSGNSLSARSSRALAQSSRLPHLAVFCAAGAALGDGAVLEALISAPGRKALCELDISEWPLEEQRLRKVFASSAARRLQRLTLDRLGLQEIGLQFLAPLRLTALTMQGNSLDATGVRTLLGMPMAAELRHLDLGMNELADAGAIALAGSPRVKNLRVLDLFANEVGSAGAEALAQSPYLGGLRQLRLNFNKIGDVGGRALARSESLADLDWLHLGSNPIKKLVKETLQNCYGDRVNLRSD